MKTELEIIHAIIEAVTDSNYNNDLNLSERYLRAILRTSRANELRIYYENGMTVSDEVKQRRRIKFKSTRLGRSINPNIYPIAPDEYSSEIPKLIEFNGYAGSLELMGIPIPIIPSHEYHNSKYDSFQKKLFFAKRDLKRVVLFAPTESDCVSEGPNGAIKHHIFNPANGTGVNREFYLDIYGVFHNPDDASDYNWEEDPWPFPSERFDQFFTNLIRRQFGIMQGAKKDEVQNNREDTIRYHDNTDVNRTS